MRKLTLGILCSSFSFSIAGYGAVSEVTEPNNGAKAPIN